MCNYYYKENPCNIHNEFISYKMKDENGDDDGEELCKMTEM